MVSVKRLGVRIRLPGLRWRILVYVGLTAAAALVMLAFWLGSIERRFIYFPDRDVSGSPADFGLKFDEVYFPASDGTELHGWYVAGKTDVTWLWFHGNAGNIGHRLDNLKRLHDRLGVNIFLFDYRGYGRSQCQPSEQGTYVDAQAALTYLRSRPEVNEEKITYFGRSLGAGVAVELARSDPPYALILESPLPSIREMARRAYPFLPLGPLLRTQYDSLVKIGAIQAPLLVLHGDRDDIVPIDAGRKLFDAANEPKAFYTISGAGHNDTYSVGGEEYFAALGSFLSGLERSNVDTRKVGP